LAIRIDTLAFFGGLRNKKRKTPPEKPGGVVKTFSELECPLDE
jgi:hypothetical protein